MCFFAIAARKANIGGQSPLQLEGRSQRGQQVHIKLQQLEQSILNWTQEVEWATALEVTAANFKSQYLI